MNTYYEWRYSKQWLRDTKQRSAGDVVTGSRLVTEGSALPPSNEHLLWMALQQAMVLRDTKQRSAGDVVTGSTKPPSNEHLLWMALQQAMVTWYEATKCRRCSYWLKTCYRRVGFAALKWTLIMNGVTASNGITWYEATKCRRCSYWLNKAALKWTLIMNGVTASNGYVIRSNEVQEM